MPADVRTHGVPDRSSWRHPTVTSEDQNIITPEDGYLHCRTNTVSCETPNTSGSVRNTRRPKRDPSLPDVLIRCKVRKVTSGAQHINLYGLKITPEQTKKLEVVHQVGKHSHTKDMTSIGKYKETSKAEVYTIR